MAEVKISIGGREFEVACRNGEEHYLQSAAKMLDNEASALKEALGRMPESRMLLMAGLMLADKTASLEDQLKAGGGVGGDNGGPSAEGGADRSAKAEKKLANAQAALAEAKAELSEAEAKMAKTEAALAEAEGVRDAAVKTMQGMVKQMEDAAEGMKKAG